MKKKLQSPVHSTIRGKMKPLKNGLHLDVLKLHGWLIGSIFLKYSKKWVIWINCLVKNSWIGIHTDYTVALIKWMSWGKNPDQSFMWITWIRFKHFHLILHLYTDLILTRVSHKMPISCFVHLSNSVWIMKFWRHKNLLSKLTHSFFAPCARARYSH